MSFDYLDSFDSADVVADSFRTMIYRH